MITCPVGRNAAAEGAAASASEARGWPLEPPSGAVAPRETEGRGKRGEGGQQRCVRCVQCKRAEAEGTAAVFPCASTDAARTETDDGSRRNDQSGPLRPFDGHGPGHGRWHPADGHGWRRGQEQRGGRVQVAGGEGARLCPRGVRGHGEGVLRIGEELLTSTFCRKVRIFLSVFSHLDSHQAHGTGESPWAECFPEDPQDEVSVEVSDVHAGIRGYPLRQEAEVQHAGRIRARPGRE